MKSVISDTKVPIKIWESLENVEPQAINQLRNVANLPGVFHHVAVMPDVHFGKGATVGSVIATHGNISPAAVGVDIGCGMLALPVGAKEGNLDNNLVGLRHAIESLVPVGHQKHMHEQEWEGMRQFRDLSPHVRDLKEKAAKQLGTLGGGNHFIEICVDEQDFVWILLHSGSRHIGKSLADVHIHTAKGLMKKYLIDLPDPDLAYLVKGTDEYASYMFDLHWAQTYARANREFMKEYVLKALSYLNIPTVPAMAINCHHNYVSHEQHFGEDVLVTRKGAVSAQSGELGIIPGSMGACTYIVKGLGNPESFCSCSHGAGRKMSRNQARREFTVADLLKQTEGIECRKDSEVIDEIPGAYKDIDTVMNNQKDLVEVVAKLKQVLCVKG